MKNLLVATSPFLQQEAELLVVALLHIYANVDGMDKYFE
jgi:hypothetical protein